MTEPTDFDPDDELLPGLGEPDRAAGLMGLVERAARRTIAGLEDRLDESHAVMCEALLTAARQLDRAATSSKAKDYGVANLLAQLRETYVVLRGDSPEGGEGSDPFDELAGDLRAAAKRAAAVAD